MAKKSFKCKLVTPAAALLEAEVSYASVPAWDGLIGFLPGRAAFLGKLGVGELRLDMADGSGKGGHRSFMVDGGFIKMADDVMTILAERAIAAEDIAPGAAEAEIKAIPADADSTKRLHAKARASTMAKLASSKH
ncbi:MAG: F0F1 ATP synthase subunit epsilon [Planctomycetes bacterium]|nr:F0F1 ATP synthase subunit epsilon [Planctomycetota bacterium]